MQDMCSVALNGRCAKPHPMASLDNDYQLIGSGKFRNA